MVHNRRYRYRTSDWMYQAGQLARNFIPLALRDNPMTAYGAIAAARAFRLARDLRREESNRKRKRPNVDHTLDEPSQSRARPHMPRRAGPTETGRPDPDDPSRPFKRARTMKRPGAYYKVSNRAKKFRRARKPVKTKGKFVARNYDDYGTMEKDHAWYMGFQHHGSRERLYDIIGEAVTKAMLAKIKVYPRSYDEVVTSPDYNNALLYFTRVTAAGVDEDVYSSVDLNGNTFKAIADNVAGKIHLHAHGSVTTAPTTDTVARYLHKIKLRNSTDETKASMEIKDIGESLVIVKVKQRIRFQNITKNIDGTQALDQAGLNPLRGRKYVFANYRPNLIKEVQAVDTSIDGFMASDPAITGGDGCTGIAVVPAVGTSFPKDHRLNHPPIAKQLFTNCKASAAITMPAGCAKVESTSFSITHKMKTLIERIYYAGFDKGAFGGCTWFGLEKAHRQAQPSGAANDDRIAIGFNREVHMYAQCRFKTQKSMLKHYDQSDLGLIAAA